MPDISKAVASLSITKNWFRVFPSRKYAALFVGGLSVGFSLFLTILGINTSFSVNTSSVQLPVQILNGTNEKNSDIGANLFALRSAPIVKPASNFFFPGKNLIFRFHAPSVFPGAVIDARLIRTSGLKVYAISPEGTFIPLTYNLTSAGFQLRNVFEEISSKRDVEIVGGFITKEFSRPQFRMLEAEQAATGLSGFDRAGSLMIGSVIAIALFSLILGSLCKDSVFYVFAVWSVLMLRTAAFTGGWDATWLGINFSENQNDFLLRMSLSACPSVTVLLFCKLFEKHIKGWMEYGFKVVLALGIAVFIVSIFLSYETSVVLVRYVSLIGITFCFCAMIGLMKLAPNRVLLLYALGWTAFFVGILADIATVAGVMPVALQSYLNSQVSVVVSVLMIACSLAERMNVERSDRIAAEVRERNALEKFRSTYESTPIGLCAIDASYALKSANPHCRKLLASYGHFDLPILATDFFGKDNFLYLLNSVESTSETQDLPLELEIRCSNRKSVWLAVRMVKSKAGFECTIADVSQTKIAEQRADWLVDHDSVTSLLNRRGFYLRLEESVTKLGDDHIAYLLAIKIENFRQYTTYFGEFFASELAKAVALRISQAGVDFEGLGRTGENIFFAVLVAQTRSEIGEKVDLLSQSLNRSAFSVDDRELVVSLAFAAVELDRQIELKTSVAACEIAVGKPANKQVSHEKVFNTGDTKLLKIMEELDLVSQFRFEFPASRLFLVAQPIISSRFAHNSLSYEILVRMRGSNGDVIAPDRFIPAVEKSGLMSRLDEWVISNAFEWLVNNQDHLGQLTYVSINLSGASLNDVKFLNTILALALKYPQVVRKTCFEITEGVALANFESTIRFIDTLRALGAKIALDDFGAGYTSFGYLAELNADFVKVDGSLIKGLQLGSSRYEIVKGIVSIAHSLGIQVVAEWVEDVSTIIILQDIGVNSLQGWALSKPLSLTEVGTARNGLDFVKSTAVTQILHAPQSILEFNI
jgi:EAL domain-containing protein (putative c-di-GMP-specific phosphodiesterase class I)/GGDEF domain-containing protein/PAS domain-containing protein